LLLADIEDVRAVFGPRAQITIPALEPAKLRQYVGDAPGVPEIVQAAAAGVRDLAWPAWAPHGSWQDDRLPLRRGYRDPR
jgi:hypothetical protein